MYKEVNALRNVSLMSFVVLEMDLMTTGKKDNFKIHSKEIIDKNICNAGWTFDRIREYPIVTGIEWYDKKYANP
jgi:hypothetical protein